MGDAKLPLTLPLPLPLPLLSALRLDGDSGRECEWSSSLLPLLPPPPPLGSKGTSLRSARSFGRRAPAARARMGEEELMMRPLQLMLLLSLLVDRLRRRE
jgi:hypothetical protein